MINVRHFFVALSFMACAVTAQAAPISVLTDFETDAQGSAVSAGVIAAADLDQFEGYTLSTNAPSTNPLALFETSPISGPDPDLETDAGTTDQGLVLIINTTTGPVLNDFAGGGEIVFAFDAPTLLGSISLLDDITGEFILDFSDGTQQVIDFGQDGENSQLTYNFATGLTEGAELVTGTPIFDVTGPITKSVSALTVSLDGSGAVSGLEFTAIPEPSSVVLAGLGLAAVGLVVRRRA